ncbi:MAG: hypothetical protein Q9187_008163 [Circinaria calcarea]
MLDHLTMSEITRISVKICPGNDIEEHNSHAFLDETLQKNWISERLSNILELQPSSYTDKISVDWRGRKLQSVGVVTLSWSRSDVEIPNSYTTAFHVTHDDSLHLIIGNELLSKEKRIRDPQEGVLILTSSTKGTKVMQAEIAKTKQEHDAKIKSRDARLAEREQHALQAQKTRSGEASSSGAKAKSPGGGE